MLYLQSEKRKQDLLAKLLLEEQHGRDISKIVKELLSDPKNTVVEKPSRARKVLSPLFRAHTQFEMCILFLGKFVYKDFNLRCSEE
jgi:hypothetical protein